MEVRRRCHGSKLQPPGRNTVARRWAAHRELQAASLADDPAAAVAPGSFGAQAPLDIIQIDHTQADVFVVDEWFRRTVGRPWLSVPIDLATRAWWASTSAWSGPTPATVALLLSRLVLPKDAWLQRHGRKPQ